ncbi:DMT family transporter [Candidatus Gottesmanbacteria bacterium]|nr:DMT family transporter [Candidatus Gottesmanbacteria bacterium]
MSSRTKALLAILLAQLLWSTAGLSKIIVRTFDPYFAGFLRFFVASIVILPFFLKETSKPKHMIRDLLPFSLMGAGNMLFYFIGLQTSTANAATLIYAAVPLVTSLIARRFINERLTIRTLAGITVGLVGVILIALLPMLERGESVSGNLPGNMFFVLAAVVWSIYLIGSRHASSAKGYSPLTISSFLIFTSCAVFFIMSLFTFKTPYLAALQKPSIFLLVAHLGIFVSVATFTLYQWAIKHTSATTASLSTYIGPIFGVGVNVIALGEKITPAFVAGAVIVFTGLWIIHGKNLINEARSWAKK